MTDQNTLTVRLNHVNQALMHLNHAYPQPSEGIRYAIEVVTKEQNNLRAALEIEKLKNKTEAEQAAHSTSV